ncbi:hypothetical protein KKC08_01420 [Patescibacteria group bacterium]|nr:hypothetical protein [Patescibacteria group bacterium]MCG2702267.1 hypothetical protein [Candidatus Parcubacteria bacterium]MBU4210049.1 hypothetical protein [Patescibacteria group bacterium]MBU4264719.1 hypothetical protein [Patescibacteria group bacterium]MBU4390057.1 hypothetical protein [Patescibacteria group bacterium]
MKKQKISKYLIFISSFTLFLIFFLIVQKSYSNLIGPSQQIKTSSVMQKIDPNLNIDTLLEIEKRDEFTSVPISRPSIIASPSSILQPTLGSEEEPTINPNE